MSAQTLPSICAPDEADAGPTPETLARADFVDDVISETDSATGKRTTIAVRRNVAQLPLDRYYGRCLLAPADEVKNKRLYDAGTKFRHQYYLARSAPSVTTNYEKFALAGVSGRGAGLNMSERRISAQQSVNRAILALGEDHAAVILDVCVEDLNAAASIKRRRKVTDRAYAAAKGISDLRNALGVLANYYALRASFGRQDVERPAQHG